MEKLKKLIKKIQWKKVIYAVLTFILAICLIAAAALATVRLTFFNQDFLTERLNTSEFYVDRRAELVDELSDLGDASGIERGFFEENVDEIILRDDIQSFVENFYSGKELTVNTADFEESLRDSLEKYIKNHKLKNVDEKNVSYFLTQACRIYSKNVKLPYFSSLQKTVNEKGSVFVVYIILLLLLSAAIILVLILTNEWKHRGIRYVHTATASSGLFLLLAPLFVLVSGLTGKIAILSRSLSDIIHSAINGFLWDMIIIAVFLLIISSVLWVVHAKVRRNSAI